MKKASRGMNPAPTMRASCKRVRRARRARSTRGQQVDDVEEPVDRPDDLDHLGLARAVLEGDADADQDEQEGPDDIGHDPVPAQGAVDPAHVLRQVLGPRWARAARRSL